MRAASNSLFASLRALWRGLLEPRFYLLLVLALVVWSLAYQSKSEYNVHIADLAYHPYIFNFNDIETTTAAPVFKYRWSKANPEILLPGIGNEPLRLSITTIGSRPGGPPPLITLNVRGQTFILQTHHEEHTDTFNIERGDAFDGDFDLKMSVPSFSPPGDPRELGVIIKLVRVTPSDYGLRPVVVPPVGTLGALLLGTIAFYLFGLVTTRRPPLSLVLAAGSAITVAILIVVARPDLGFLAGQLPSLCAWGLLFALLGRTVLDGVVAPQGKWALFVVAGGSAAFALAFVVRFGGLTNAQFLTSDLFLHIHNTEAVLRGDWLFSEPLPDGTLVPYPPAHYVLVSLLSWLVGSSEETMGLLLKWTGSLLDASTCLALAWAGWRLVPGALGGLAALAYAFSPAPFDLFSAGNYTNIFGQSMLNLTLLGGLVFLGIRATPGGPLAPALLILGFGLTMLGHYGMMLGTLAILGLFAFWTFFAAARKKDARNALWLLASAVIALAGSFALYYWHFTAEMWSQWSGVFGKLAGNQAAGSATPAGKPGFLQSLLKLPGKIFELAGGLMVAAGVFGLDLLSRLTWQARALLSSWLLATSVFALLDQVVGDSVRWYYLGAAPVSLLAGRFTSGLAMRSRWSRALLVLLLGATALYMLVFWVGLIYTRYH